MLPRVQSTLALLISSLLAPAVAQPQVPDVEQLHVSVVGEARVAVSWASPSGTEANLTIEEMETLESGRPIAIGSRRVISPSVTSYSLKNGDERLGPPDLYSSPLLLHAEIDVHPGSWYRYRVGATDWRNFRSPPGAGAERLRVAVVGDIGQTEYSRMTCQSLAVAHAAHTLDVAVLVGDLAYADGNASRWDSFGRMFEETGCADVPWLVIPGNHEIDPDLLSGEPFLPYRRRWRTPEAKPEEVGNDFKVLDWDTYDFQSRYDFGGSFWAVRLGPVHFVALNPYTSASEGSPQIRWLEQELARVNRSQTPYVVALTHAPWRTSSAAHITSREKATRQLRDTAERRLVAVGADLLLSGHVHAYERTKPIQGVRHLTIGNGGNHERLYNSWRTAPYSAFHQGVHYGWGELDFWQDAYSLLMRRSSDSAVIDSLVAARQPPTGHSRHSQGWQPGRPHEDPSSQDVLIASLVACLMLLGCISYCLLRRRRGDSAEERRGFRASPSAIGAGANYD